ncbi:MAG: crotonobetainyl-CoA:carnitine CoA-transferase CaiB-like acyl-CoA transferase [Glaciecola sp.]|jgi:crotonobetainyl-CoA:carnitine CoA-transferase CaiB-like acyl-CoA transferase
MATKTAENGPLAGVRVLDASNVLAGPLCCQILGDFGADVIKLEHPTKGDSFRNHGQAKDGHGLWWKMLARNKRCVGLYLGDPQGAEVFLDLVRESDVVVENFRPGTLEKWGVGFEQMRAVNPGVILLRVTGFGQTGPYADRAGFGTLIESMSGFAAATGEPDGPPTLPPLGLADSVAAMAGANAVLMALYHRDAQNGVGQEIDLSLLEPLTTVMGPHLITYDQLGTVAPRMGNRSANNAPRNTYRTADGKWVAVSTSANSVAERVLRLVGHPEVIDEPWFASGVERAKRADLLDGWVADWILERTMDVVLAEFEAAQAAVAPIYGPAELIDDPQVKALEMVTTVEDPDLGPVRMQNVLFRLSETPGRIRWTGRDLGADTDEVLAELGRTPEQIAQLRASGVIG